MAGNGKLDAIKQDGLGVVRAWLNDLDDVRGDLKGDYKAAADKAHELATKVEAGLQSEGWTEELKNLALASVDRQLKNRWEQADDKAIAEAKKISIQRAIFGGLDMLFGIARRVIGAGG